MFQCIGFFWLKYIGCTLDALMNSTIGVDINETKSEDPNLDNVVQFWWTSVSTWGLEQWLSGAIAFIALFIAFHGSLTSQISNSRTLWLCCVLTPHGFIDSSRLISSYDIFGYPNPTIHDAYLRTGAHFVSYVALWVYVGPTLSTRFLFLFFLFNHYCDDNVGGILS